MCWQFLCCRRCWFNEVGNCKFMYSWKVHQLWVVEMWYWVIWSKISVLKYTTKLIVIVLVSFYIYIKHTRKTNRIGYYQIQTRVIEKTQSVLWSEREILIFQWNRVWIGVWSGVSMRVRKKVNNLSTHNTQHTTHSTTTRFEWWNVTRDIARYITYTMQCNGASSHRGIVLVVNGTGGWEQKKWSTKWTCVHNEVYDQKK